MIAPGQGSYTATATFYESYLPASTAGITIAFSPIGVNYIPIVYVKNVDASNLLLVNLLPVGGGGGFGFQLQTGGYIFLFNPISKGVGPGVGGIDSGVGLKVTNAASSGTCACEIFLAV